jgi:hypothetical protein
MGESRTESRPETRQPEEAAAPKERRRLSALLSRL